MLSLSGLVTGLCMALFTLRDGVSITGTLGDKVMSACVHGGGIDSIIDTLRDMYVLTCDSVFVRMFGC